MEPLATDATQIDVGLFSALRKYWWIVFLVTLLGGTAGLLFSTVQDTRYTATARVLLDNPSRQENADTTISRIDPERRLQNEVERIQSGEVLRLAGEKLATTLGPEYRSAKRLDSDITVTGAPDLDLITVSASEPGAPAAASVANAVVEAYEEVVTERRNADLDRALAELDAYGGRLQETIAQQLPGTVDREVTLREYSQLQTRIAQMKLDKSLSGSGVDVFEKAAAPTDPTQPKPVRNGAVGGVLGLLLGSAVAWSLVGRPSARDNGAIADTLGVPHFGSLHATAERSDRAIDLGAATNLSARGRVMAAGVLHHLADGGRTLLIAGTGLGRGHAATTMAIAVAAARSGRRIVVIDADAEHRLITRLCQAEGLRGLTDLLADDADATNVMYQFLVPETNDLYVVPFGCRSDARGQLVSYLPTRSSRSEPANTSAPERSQQFGWFDIVIVDGPGLLTSASAVEIAAAVDAVLLSLDESVPPDQLANVRNRLELVEAKVIGFVTSDSKRRKVSPRVVGTPPLGTGYFSRESHD